MTVKSLFSERESLRSIRKRSRVAFVLGGGGNLGAIQVGQLRALLERNIVPDAVIGCSVGALNGAAIAGSPTIEETQRLATLWNGLGRHDIFPSPNRTRGPWLFLRHGLSAYSDHGLRRVIDKWLQFRSFDDAKVPFYAVATALRTGLEHWFERGDVVPALLASTALPGFLPPVTIDGEDYIDGGVVNNVPISKAFQLQASRVYVLDCGNMERERKTPNRPYEVLMQAVNIARSHRFRAESGDIPDGVELVKLPTIDPGKIKFDDFGRSAELIERAHRASAAFLDKTALRATA